MSATKLRPHRLAERVESSRLLLQVPCATTNQVKTRIRRIDADKDKLTTQAKVNRKRNRPELIDLAKEPSGQNVSKLINYTLNYTVV